jgi:hypothetical protein
LNTASRLSQAGRLDDEKDVVISDTLGATKAGFLNLCQSAYFQENPEFDAPARPADGLSRASGKISLREMSKASHGRCAGRLGPIPRALRQRSERSRFFSRRSSGVNRVLGIKAANASGGLAD